MAAAKLEHAPLSLESATTQELDSLIPTIAKDATRLAEIEERVRSLRTTHELVVGDARHLSFLKDASVHLVVTSPPYWTLKRYSDVDGQLGHVQDYQEFHRELNKAWQECLRVLVPGGRLVVVVGDVVVSRKSEFGRHKNFPLHADIQVNCERLGFDNLTPIFWVKIANATYEVPGGGGFLGKPFEPGAIIKNDSEFILMFRKPGGYRSPSPRARLLSVIPAGAQKRWFSQVWTDIPGTSANGHPAPYPADLAERLIRMFSFVGDTVLDPFAGTGSTMVAAMGCGRNSVGVEIDEGYAGATKRRLLKVAASLDGPRDVRYRSVKPKERKSRQD